MSACDKVRPNSDTASLCRHPGKTDNSNLQRRIVRRGGAPVARALSPKQIPDRIV